MSVTEGAAPRPPFLLTSLTAAALLDGRGDLELPLETRGTVVEWGGVYGQSVRLTGSWGLLLIDEEGATPLSATVVTTSRVPGGVRTRHHWKGIELVHDVVAVGDPPGVVRTLRASVPQGTPRRFQIVSRFAPYLFPVSVEGIRPVAFHAETTLQGVRIVQRGFGLLYRSSRLFSHLYLNRGSWLGGRYDGRLDEIASAQEVDLEPDIPVQISWMIAGGLERDLKSVEPGVDRVLLDPDAAGRTVDEADRAWSVSTPSLRFPDSPVIEQAYELARGGLRRLYCAPGDGLAGLSAGYPWYSAIWCRDLAWMLPAVLWLGDVEWTRRSIDSVLRFQGRSEVSILGGEPGELPMQISPGPIFLYGTSDTTLYYPELIERFARHAGRDAVPGAWILGVERILAWGRSRSDAGSGLIRNGGEARAMSDASSTMARIRLGIDAADTTIWDSTDRRDHAIDVQVLWWQTLRSATTLLAADHDEAYTQPILALRGRLARTLVSQYRWDAENYLYDSWNTDGPVARVRPNALRAVSAGLFDPVTARKVVRRATADDLTTPWGVRTLSARDPAYVPHAYHDGQVWPIATVWAADAALVVGERDAGFRLVTQLSEQLVRQDGGAHECYRGDRDVPFDSCFLLGFSLAPFLTLLFERVWGLTIDAAASRLAVRPMFPAAWSSASIDRLRVGVGHVRLDWTRGVLSIRWSGPGSVQIDTASGSITIAPGGTGEIASLLPAVDSSP